MVKQNEILNEQRASMRHKDIEALFKDYKPPTPLKPVTPSVNNGDSYDDESNVGSSEESEHL